MHIKSTHSDVIYIVQSYYRYLGHVLVERGGRRDERTVVLHRGGDRHDVQVYAHLTHVAAAPKKKDILLKTKNDFYRK